MTATNHALTGAVIALVVKHPEIAIPLALLSHFVVDMIPHFDAGYAHLRLAKMVVAVDSVIAGSLTIALSLLLNTHVADWIIFLCMFAAISPDLVWGARYFIFKDFKRATSEPLDRFSRWHQKIQFSETHPGILVEAGWLLLMVGLIKTLVS